MRVALLTAMPHQSDNEGGAGQGTDAFAVRGAELVSD